MLPYWVNYSANKLTYYPFELLRHLGNVYAFQVERGIYTRKQTSIWVCKVWPVYVYSQCIMKVFSIRMRVHYDLNDFFAFLICYGRDQCCWLEKCCKPKVEVENLEILEKSLKHSLVSLTHCTVKISQLFDNSRSHANVVLLKLYMESLMWLKFSPDKRDCWFEFCTALNLC